MPLQLIIWERDGLTDQTRRLNRGKYSGLSYSLMVGERAKLDFTFEINPDGDYLPTIGCPVYYYESEGNTAELTFAGKILDRTPHWFGNGLYYVRASCVSLEYLFDSTLAPAKVYDGMTARAIFIDLVSPIISKASALIQLGSVIGGLTISKLSFNGETYVKDALDQLVTIMTKEAGTNWAWGVALNTSPLPSVYFRPPEARGITITGQPQEILWDTLEFDETASALVTQIRISAAADIFPPSSWCFRHPSPASRVYTLPFAPSQVTGARIVRTTPVMFSSSGAAAALVNLSAIPNSGDTLTVGNITYTFVAALDNTEQNQIRIGGTVALSLANIADAINADPATSGSAFSWPTVENDLVNAEKLAPASIYFWAKRAGAGANVIPVASTVAGLAVIGTDGFPASSLTGGTDPPAGYSDIPLRAVNSTDRSNITQPTLLWQPGQQDVTVLVPQLTGEPPVTDFSDDPVPVFWVLEVQYQRLGGGAITVENTAMIDALSAIEHSRVGYQRSITVSNAADLATAYQLAKKILAQQGTIPTTVKFGSLRNFYHPNDFLYFDTAIPTSILNGRQLVIQEIQGDYWPGLDRIRNFTVKKTVSAIGGSIITKAETWLDFWRGLAKISKSPTLSLPVLPGPSPNVLTIGVANATIGPDVAEHIPLQQSCEALQVILTPKISPILDLTGVFKSDGVPFFPILIPAGTAADTQIVVDPATWLITPPAILKAGTLQTIDITGGDGVEDYRGVFTVRVDVKPVAAG